jgi:mono/diheme cytochrome c family protein
MKKILKWVAIVFGGLVGLVVALLFVIVLISSSKMNQDFSDVRVVPINIPTDQASIDYGEHIFQSYGLCAECHTDNAGGDNMGDDPIFGRLIASNLTAGKGGVGQTFQDIDYLRAIRHGLGPDNKPLIIMPSQHFTKLSDRDVSTLIAYIKSVPPVDNELPKTKLGPLGRVIAMMA